MLEASSSSFKGKGKGRNTEERVIRSLLAELLVLLRVLFMSLPSLHLHIVLPALQCAARPLVPNLPIR